MLSKLGELNVPESMRMILVLNPMASKSPLTLPPSFLQVTLTTPYRSTIAITSLARFMAERGNFVLPEGDFGSDVEGTKPIFFDVGNDERKMEEALEYCHKHLGDKAIILYDYQIPHSFEQMVKKKGKKTGGPWDWYDAWDFYGWEADRVVAVTCKASIMELITRARTHLSVILVEGSDHYAKHKEYFQQAADLGLIEMVQLSGGETVETSQADYEADVDEGEIEDKTVEAVEEKSEKKISYMLGCCIL